MAELYRLDAGSGKCPAGINRQRVPGFETWLSVAAGHSAVFFGALLKFGYVTAEMKTKRDRVAEDSLPPDVIRAIEQGRKIEAIKLLREATGLGLANAKVLVDKSSREHAPKQAHPRLVDDGPHLGPLLKALLLVGLAFAAYRYYGGG